MLTTTLSLTPMEHGPRQSRYLYSHFAEHLGGCIYPGIWVGPESPLADRNGFRKETVTALKALDLPALRWPGGCFADNYHWTDGIGPRDQRPVRPNQWWKSIEPNTFGTDEFLQFCEAIGTEPYICANVGSGTVEEARSWVEYCNSSLDTTWVRRRRENGHPDPYGVKFWGVGNENWCCGGRMRPEYYADLYRRYANYMKPTIGEDGKLVACGSYPEMPEWDERFFSAMKGALDSVDYIALHIYTGWGLDDLDVSEKEYWKLLDDISIMDRHLTRAGTLAQAYSTYGHTIKVIMDEWGSWYRQAKTENGLYQQNTLRDAVFAATTFHLFHRHAETLDMSNMAQTVNVLQALLLTDDVHVIKTPTYHIYDLYRGHRDKFRIPSRISPDVATTGPDGAEREMLSVSASANEEESEVFVSIVNLDFHQPIAIQLDITTGHPVYHIREARQLSTADAHQHNSAGHPDAVLPKQLNITGDTRTPLDIQCPKHSVTTIALESR